jgi:lipid A 3-O-deacylase
MSSSFWNSRLQLEPSAAEKQAELYFFYKPEIKYQLYNATIQGGLFRDDKGEITSTPESFVLSQAIGITFSIPRYCITYQVVFQGKEAISQFYNQSYASLVMAYRF